jgi:alpha-tubulin suppressor-like RCC1 family protein
VAGGRRFRQVRAGYYFTCAITPFDAAFCWGKNDEGQLGDGTLVPEGRATPVRVLGGLEWRQLSAGGDHTCGVTQTDRVYCWGVNRYGHLGDGTTTRRLKPVAVASGRRFRQVDAGGTHTCAVTTANAAYCWGNGGLGQLGDGTNTSRLTPRAVAGQLSFDHVSAGNFHTCGVTTGGSGYCWGYNRGFGLVGGQLGDGTSIDRSSPTPLGISLSLRQVSAGLVHTCGVTTNNRAYCWGPNTGRLGDGTTELRLLPVPVAAPSS